MTPLTRLGNSLSSPWVSASAMVPPGPEKALSAWLIVPATSRSSMAGSDGSAGASEGATEGSTDGSTDGAAGSLGDGACEVGVPTAVLQAASTITRIERARMDRIG